MLRARVERGMERMTNQARTLRLAWLRLTLGVLQMFGAIFAAIMVMRTGISVWSLGAAVGTGVITTISIILFGKKPFGILRQGDSADAGRE